MGIASTSSICGWGKTSGFGSTRSTPLVDFYNLLNSDAVLNESSAYLASAQAAVCRQAVLRQVWRADQLLR